jgi:hypothetical protein
LLVVVLDNRTGYGPTGSTSNEGTAASKRKAPKSHEKNCISHFISPFPAQITAKIKIPAIIAAAVNS